MHCEAKSLRKFGIVAISNTKQWPSQWKRGELRSTRERTWECGIWRGWHAKSATVSLRSQAAWHLAIHKEMKLGSQFTLYKFQMDPNFNIKKKIIRVAEENKSAGWERPRFL